MRPDVKSICLKAEEIMMLVPHEMDVELSMIWFLSHGADRNVLTISSSIRKEIDELMKRYKGWHKNDFKILHFLVKGNDN